MSRPSPTPALLLGAALLAGCSATPTMPEPPAYGAIGTPQLFDGMGPHARPVTTDSAEAQAYFDQGLNWLYAFNHDEAVRSFTRAAEIDPGCAMAWSGHVNRINVIQTADDIPGVFSYR